MMAKLAAAGYVVEVVLDDGDCGFRCAFLGSKPA